MKVVGKNVKKLREDSGLSQEKMASFGFNYRYLQKIEAGRVNMTLDMLVRLAGVLKCKLPDLLKF